MTTCNDPECICCIPENLHMCSFPEVTTEGLVFECPECQRTWTSFALTEKHVTEYTWNKYFKDKKQVLGWGRKPYTALNEPV